MDDYPKLFGLRIRELRQEIGFSQERLADIAGLDRSYVGGIERGTRNPSLKNILAISKALGVPPADLFPRKPVRISQGRKSKEDTGPTETDLLWGFGDGVSVPAISWIDRHILTPLYQQKVKSKGSS